MSLAKPLISYEFFKDMIEYVRRYWRERKKNFPEYFFVYPKLNQSLKWLYKANNKFRSKKKYGRVFN